MMAPQATGALCMAALSADALGDVALPLGSGQRHPSKCRAAALGGLTQGNEGGWGYPMWAQPTERL